MVSLKLLAIQSDQSHLFILYRSFLNHGVLMCRRWVLLFVIN